MAQCGRKWPNVILGGGKVIPKYRNCNLFNRQRRKKMLRFWPEKKCQQKVSFNRCFSKKNLKEMMCEAIFLKKVISCFQLIGSQGQQQLPTQRDQRYGGPLCRILQQKGTVGHLAYLIERYTSQFVPHLMCALFSQKVVGV